MPRAALTIGGTHEQQTPGDPAGGGSGTGCRPGSLSGPVPQCGSGTHDRRQRLRPHRQRPVKDPARKHPNRLPPPTSEDGSPPGAVCARHGKVHDREFFRDGVGSVVRGRRGCGRGGRRSGGWRKGRGICGGGICGGGICGRGICGGVLLRRGTVGAPLSAAEFFLFLALLREFALAFGIRIGGSGHGAAFRLSPGETGGEPGLVGEPVRDGGDRPPAHGLNALLWVNCHHGANRAIRQPQAGRITGVRSRARRRRRGGGGWRRRGSGLDRGGRGSRRRGGGRRRQRTGAGG